MLLFLISAPSQIQKSFAQIENIDSIEIEIHGWDKIESESSDVLVLDVSFVNNGEASIDIFTDYLILIDSQKQSVSPSSYLELKDEGFFILFEDCTNNSTFSLMPGLSQNENLCYKIPKDAKSSFSMEIYNMLPDLCAEPIFECNSKSFSFSLQAQPEKESSCIEKLGEDQVIVMTDKDDYDKGDTISVYGCLSEEAFTKGVNIVLYDPNGEQIESSTFVPNTDRTFFQEFEIDEKFGLNGTYSVEVDAGGMYSSSKSFVVPEFGPLALIVFGTSLGIIFLGRNLKPIFSQ